MRSCNKLLITISFLKMVWSVAKLRALDSNSEVFNITNKLIISNIWLPPSPTPVLAFVPPQKYHEYYLNLTLPLMLRETDIYKPEGKIPCLRIHLIIIMSKGFMNESSSWPLWQFLVITRSFKMQNDSLVNLSSVSTPSWVNIKILITLVYESHWEFNGL